MAGDAAVRRRRFIGLAAALPLVARAQQLFLPPQDIRPLIARLASGARPVAGGIEIEVPQIAENGNAVPLRIRVASAMTPADHVRAIHVIAERNPRPLVASFHLGPASGRAEVATRVRLSGTQNVTVLAVHSDGSVRIAEARVLVTTGACLDESL